MFKSAHGISALIAIFSVISHGSDVRAGLFGDCGVDCDGRPGISRPGFGAPSSPSPSVSEQSFAGLAPSARPAPDGSRSEVKIDQSGAPTSRTCKVRITPVLTEGGSRAPALVLATLGPNAIDSLQITLENEAKFSEPVVVFNNERAPLKLATYKASGTTGDLSPGAFMSSPLAVAAKSGKPFHVTAKHADSRGFVSGRFEGVDLVDILKKLGMSCLFDVESYLGDDEARAREAALGLSYNDVEIIRWVLLKKYQGRSEMPNYSTGLRGVERTFLKKYYTEKGLGPSGYLSSNIVSILKSDAKLLNIPPETPAYTPPPPPAPEPEPPSDTFVFKLCNTSSHVIASAVAGRTYASPGEHRVAGWYIVGRGDCEVIGTYLKGWFYIYGEEKDSGGRWYWGGKKTKDDAWVCVVYPGPFDRSAANKCKGKRRKGFTGKLVDDSMLIDGVYTYTMND
jgi:hypothetical protein